jgi:hypothetical protein
MMWPPVADDPPHRDAGFANAVPTVRAMTVSRKPSVTDPNTHAHAYDAASVCARSATRAASSSMTMPGFDRLSQTDLVGDEHAAVGRLKELANRLELIGLQVRARAELVERRPQLGRGLRARSRGIIRSRDARMRELHSTKAFPETVCAGLEPTTSRSRDF